MTQRNRRTVAIAAGTALVVIYTLMTISGGLTSDILAASGTLTPMAYLPYISRQSTPTSTPPGLPTEVPVSTGPAQEHAPRIARRGYQVYVTWYSGNNSYVKTSTAGGWAWGLPVTIVGRHPTTAVDVNGAVYVCYDDSGTVYCIQSPNGGQMFTSPLSLGAGCSPDIAVDASGKLYVVWQEQCSGPDAFTNVILARLTVQAYGPINLMATITTTVVGRTSINYSEPPKVAVSPSGQHIRHLEMSSGLWRLRPHLLCSLHKWWRYLRAPLQSHQVHPAWRVLTRRGSFWREYRLHHLGS
jgi:hypothetical protein